MLIQETGRRVSDLRRERPLSQRVRPMCLCSRLPAVRQPNVQQARLPMGLVAAGLPQRGHGALPLHLLQVWQEDQGSQPIRQELGSATDLQCIWIALQSQKHGPMRV
jgi:hypothetical protein